MINIVIGGDLCPVRKNEASFIAGDIENIYNDLLGEFTNSDLSIINLECPLVNTSAPIAKSGPVLGVDSECINGMKAANIGVFNLANNHIMDHGQEGLNNTLEVSKDAGISTFGAGNNVEAAGKILIKEVKGIRVGMLGVAEHEFSIASENGPGANPLNLINYVRTINKFKNEFDYLIVLVHSGAAAYPLPSPNLMEISRFMVEMGADAVICQHSHCPGCYEKYKGSYIVYGQGNLIFDADERPGTPWYEGFLVRLIIREKSELSIELIPHIQSSEKIGTRKMSTARAKSFLQEIETRSSKLADSHYIKEQWIDFCNNRKDLYFYHILFGATNNKIIQVLHRKFPFARYLFTKKHRILFHNLIRCETHREIIETFFMDNEQI